MKPLFTALLFLLIVPLTYAQKHQYAYSGNNLPYWAQLMYSDSAQVDQVMTAYDAYYKTHAFTKNSHTQYYKHWVHSQQLGRSDDAFYAKLQKNASTQSTTANWQCIGPFDYDEDAGSMSYAAGAAHVYTVEQAKSNTNVLYAGTANAGIWKSVDKGLNWTLKTKDLALTATYAIEIDFTNENIVYAGAEDGRLLKSTDGGSTWAAIGGTNFGNNGYTVKDIVLDPTNASIVFVATESGFYRSTNAGSTFTKTAGDYQEIEIHPTNHNIIYTIKYNATSTRTEFYKSTDNGVSFTIKTTGWPSTGEQKRTEIAVTAASVSRVYANCTGNVNGGSGTYGTYLSTDEGETWTFQCCGTGPGGAPSTANKNLMGWADDGTDDGGQYYYDVAYAVSASDMNKVFLGGVNLWHSSNGGVDFTCPSKWSHSYKPQYVHADIHDIKIFGNDIWLACDGGIWYSGNQGATFDKRFKGIAGTDFWGFGIGYGETGHRVLTGGAYHNGTLLMDNNVYHNGWLCCNGGDGSGGEVNSTDDRMIFGNYGAQHIPGNRTAGLSGVNFTKDPNNDYTTGKASGIRYSPLLYNTVYLGETNTLWKSTDAGANFTAVKDFGEYASDFEISPQDEKTMYLCTYGSPKKIWGSTDGGTTWANISLPTALDKSTGSAYDLVCSATNASEVWAIKIGSSTSLNGFKVFHSTNKGVTWTNISTSMLDGENLQSITHHAGTNGGVYIATTRTVYYRNNTLSDWVLFNTGLPVQTPSFKILPDYWGGKVLTAGSRSIYESDFYEKAAPVAFFKVNKTTTVCNGTALTFIDQSAVEGSTGITRHWVFTGGVASSSTAPVVNVTYPLPGTYAVSLTVTDANGTDTKTINNFITVTGSCTATTDVAMNIIKGITALNKCVPQAVSAEVINAGANTINSYTLKVYLDGVLNATLPQTATLSTGQIHTVSLGNFNFTNVSAFKVTADMPNGATDNTTNNAQTVYIGGDTLNSPTVTVVSQSSNSSTGPADNLFDNDNTTIWHNNWQANAPLPHTLVFNLSTAYNLGGLDMLNRQDNSNGYPKDIEISTSADNITWSAPTTWTFAATTNWQSAYFTGTGAKYLRLKIISTISGNNTCSMAELKLRGCSTNTIAVEEKKAGTAVSIYPNPNTGSFNLSLQNLEGHTAQVKIYSLEGKLVYTKNLALSSLVTENINLTDVAAGMYIVSVSTDNYLSNTKIQVQDVARPKVKR